MKVIPPSIGLKGIGVPNSADPRAIIAQSPMTWRQVAAVAVCAVLNGLDGFDVLSISFAAPGIAQAWGIERAALGVVLSMELVGMAIGSIVMGQLADRIGSRLIALICLVVMSTGMVLAAQSNSPVELGLVRLVTGLGIGGLLASISAVAAGCANSRWKTTSVALMAGGYPLGAVIGGAFSANLLADGDWRVVFNLGAALTLAMLPLAWWLLPESLDSVLRRTTGDRRLALVNRSLAKLGHIPLASLPDNLVIERPRVRALVADALGTVTALLVAAYFLHMLSFYFLLKWTPKIVADLGFSAPQAAQVLVWINIGGVAGSFLFSLLTSRLPLRMLLVGSLALSALFIAAFGLSRASMEALKWSALAAGFATNAVIVGLYALVAASYPAHLRGGGTGLVIGLGRGGAALGPILAGLLFAAGLDRGLVATAMAVGSFLAIAAIICVWKDRPTPN
jgi:MFS family permease